MVIDDEVWLSEVDERAALAREGVADDAVCRSYTVHATTQDVPRLLQYIRQLLRANGGDLAQMIRSALKDRILSATAPFEAKQIAALHPDVKVMSLAVSVVDGSLGQGRGRVVIDCRLMVGGPT